MVSHKQTNKQGDTKAERVTIPQGTPLCLVQVKWEEMRLPVGGARGLTTPFPLQIDSQRSRLPTSLSNNRLRVYQSGTRAVVELDFGLVVTYDWDCQLTLSLPERFQNQVCGLCGNYNGNPADDFFTPDLEQVEDPDEFASHWKLDDGDYLCDDGCQNKCPACTPGQAQHYEGSPLCGMLTLPNGPFAACHESLDPQPFLKDCVYDLCVTGGERLSLCRGLSAYVQACMELGISIGDWRSLANCREYYPHCGGQGAPCLC